MKLLFSGLETLSLKHQTYIAQTTDQSQPFKIITSRPRWPFHSKEGGFKYFSTHNKTKSLVQKFNLRCHCSEQTMFNQNHCQINMHIFHLLLLYFLLWPGTELFKDM